VKGRGSSVRTIRFLRLWCGNTASGLATWGLPFLLGYAVAEGEISPTTLGILLAIRSVGFLAGVPLGGVHADRQGSRKILLTSSLAAAAGTALIWCGFVWISPASIFVMYAGALLSGTGQGACRPVYQSIVPFVVSRNDLQQANAALSISVRASVLVGPAGATLVAVQLGTAAAIAVLAVLWLLSAFAPPWPAGAAQASASRTKAFTSDLFVGFIEARRHPWFFPTLIALSAVTATGYSVTNVLVPIISAEAYGGPTLLAGSVTAYMAGALAGALATSWWHPKGRGSWALAGLATYAAVPLGLLAPDWFWLVMAAYALTGFGMELFNVIWFTAVQDQVEADKLARVSSFDFIISYGLAPLGLSAVVPLTSIFGTNTVLLATSIICLGAVLAARAAPTTDTFRDKRYERRNDHA
jgi:MFS family permease